MSSLPCLHFHWKAFEFLKLSQRTLDQRECASLAVQNSSIGDLVTHWVTNSLRVLLLLILQSDPRDLWPLRHLIRVMRRHDLTNILTIFFDNFDNFDNFDSFWQFSTMLPILTILDNFDNFWQFLIVLTFLTNEETWPDQHFYKFDNFWHFWTFFDIFWHFSTILTIFTISDNFDNFWQFLIVLTFLNKFMRIFVAWQLIVTLDSIRNSCDVLNLQTLHLPTIQSSHLPKQEKRQNPLNTALSLSYWSFAEIPILKI